MPKTEQKESNVVIFENENEQGHHPSSEGTPVVVNIPFDSCVVAIDDEERGKSAGERWSSSARHQNVKSLNEDGGSRVDLSLTDQMNISARSKSDAWKLGLITLVQQYPILWSSSRIRSPRHLKDVAWQEIADKMDENCK